MIGDWVHCCKWVFFYYKQILRTGKDKFSLVLLYLLQNGCFIAIVIFDFNRDSFWRAMHITAKVIKYKIVNFLSFPTIILNSIFKYFKISVEFLRILIPALLLINFFAFVINFLISQLQTKKNNKKLLNYFRPPTFTVCGKQLKRKLFFAILRISSSILTLITLVML